MRVAGGMTGAPFEFSLTLTKLFDEKKKIFKYISIILNVLSSASLLFFNSFYFQGPWKKIPGHRLRVVLRFRLSIFVFGQILFFKRKMEQSPIRLWCGTERTIRHIIEMKIN